MLKKIKNYVCNRNIDVFKRTIEWMEELEAFNEHEDLFHLSPFKFQQQNPWRDDF
jgi:septin family protein